MTTWPHICSIWRLQREMQKENRELVGNCWIINNHVRWTFEWCDYWSLTRYTKIKPKSRLLGKGSRWGWEQRRQWHCTHMQPFYREHTKKLRIIKIIQKHHEKKTKTTSGMSKDITKKNQKLQEALGSRVTAAAEAVNWTARMQPTFYVQTFQTW